MFDDLIAKPRPRRWQTALIVGSALAHAAVFAGVAIAAMWNIEKLEVANHVDITFRVPVPEGSSAPPPASKLPTIKQDPVTKIVKTKPPVVVQPTIVKDPEVVTGTATTATDTGAHTGGPGGDGDDPDADPSSTGTCTTPGACLDGHDGEPPVVEVRKPVVEEPPIVPPSVAKGLRYAGNDQIHPPEMVRVDMMHQGKERLRTTVQLCVDQRGDVTTLRLLQSSGFPAYDDKIQREMRGWKYKPYLVNKRPSPMCTVTLFDYRMRR